MMILVGNLKYIKGKLITELKKKRNVNLPPQSLLLTLLRKPVISKSDLDYYTAYMSMELTVFRHYYRKFH